jgi:hypothetical protein
MKYNEKGLYEQAVYSFKDFVTSTNPRMIDKSREKDATYVFIRIPYNSLYDAIFVCRYYNTYHLGDESKFEFGCYYNVRDNYIVDIQYQLKQYLAYYTYNWAEFYTDTGLMYVYDKVKQVQNILYSVVSEYALKQLETYEPNANEIVDDDHYKKQAMEFFVKSETPSDNFLPSECYECNVYDCLEYDEFPQSIIDKFKNKLTEPRGRWDDSCRLNTVYWRKFSYEQICKYLEEATLDPVVYSMWYMLRELHDCIDENKMKTVQVTFCKVIEEQGVKKRIEATVPMDSRVIKSIYQDCNYTLSYWGFTAKAERIMESAFGSRSNWDLSANAILKITYGKKTIYDREEV